MGMSPGPAVAGAVVAASTAEVDADAGNRHNELKLRKGWVETVIAGTGASTQASTRVLRLKSPPIRRHVMDRIPQTELAALGIR